MVDLAATIQDLAVRIPVFLLALTIHEFAHGWVANRLGDPTARLQGRLTLNPLAHLDIIGTIAIVLIGFGWAKPVPVDGRYLRRPRQDMILIAAAGPVSNLVLAAAVAFCYRMIPWGVAACTLDIGVLYGGCCAPQKHNPIRGMTRLRNFGLRWKPRPTSAASCALQLSACS